MHESSWYFTYDFKLLQQNIYSVCVCVFCSLVDTYSDGLGNLDFERSQLGTGMSQRSAAKRLVNALHSYAQRTNQRQFDLQTIRSVADKQNIKVSRAYVPWSSVTPTFTKNKCAFSHWLIWWSNFVRIHLCSSALLSSLLKKSVNGWHNSLFVFFFKLHPHFPFYISTH